MAVNAGELKATLSLDSTKFKKGMKSALKSAKAFGLKMAKIMAAAAVVAVAATLKFARDALDMEAIRKSFASLSGDADAMVKAMKEASGGILTTKNAMLQFNKASQLVSTDFAKRLPELLPMLRKVAASSGETIENMLNSLVTGVGRGSIMILDNLGIQIKLEEAQAKYAKTMGKTTAQLTAAEKQQALLNEVILKLSQNTKNMADPVDDVGNKVKQLWVILQDLSIFIGETFLKAIEPLIDAILRWWEANKLIIQLNLSEWVQRLATAFQLLWPALVAAGQIVVWIAELMISTFKGLFDFLLDIVEAFNKHIFEIIDPNSLKTFRRFADELFQPKGELIKNPAPVPVATKPGDQLSVGDDKCVHANDLVTNPNEPVVKAIEEEIGKVVEATNEQTVKLETANQMKTRAIIEKAKESLNPKSKFWQDLNTRDVVRGDNALSKFWRNKQIKESLATE